MATYQIRAMSLGEILDGAFAVYRRHFGTLFGIAVVCYGIPALLDVYALRGGLMFAAGMWMLARILSGVGGLIAAGATVKVVSDAYLGVEPVMGDAMHFAAGKMLRILIAGIAKYVLVFLAALLLVIPGIIVACGYAVVVQSVVLDEDLRTPTDALGRSWALTRGYKGKVFLLYVVLLVLLAVPAMAAGAVAAFVPAAAVLVALVQLLIYPIFGCAFTLFYYDLRVRKEAFDLEHLSRQIGSTEPVGA